MEIRHLRHATINRRAYDACIEAAPNGVIYGLSWWLDGVAPGWEALVLDEYRAVLPLPVKRRYGIRLVEQPLFCQFLGIFSVDVLTEGETVAFIDALQKAVRLVARLCLLNDMRPAPGEWRTRHTHLLDLRLSYQTLHSNYKPDRLLNLKRAEKEEWAIRPSHDIRPLVAWFRRFHAQNIRGGVAPGSNSTLENLFAEAEKRGVSTLWYAVKNGEAEAGAWFVRWRGRAIYLFNAATPTGRRGNARTFLLDQFIKCHAGQALLFDFESPDVPGIVQFYESFGAKPQTYSELRYNRLPGLVNTLWRAKQFFTHKKTPPSGRRQRKEVG